MYIFSSSACSVDSGLEVAKSDGRKMRCDYK